MGGKSWFKKFFVIEEGVISLSLRELTVLLSMGISATLLIMGYQACTDGTFECNMQTFPMISDVIISNEMYNRIFILLTTILMFGVQQVNIRAFYKKLYGIIPAGKNDFLFDLGLASCVALPFVGIFDEIEWMPMHFLSAGIFFGCFGIYCVLLARYLYNNKERFPEREHASIDSMIWHTWGLMAVLLTFVTSPLLGYRAWLCPVAEWATVLYYANFFAIAANTNGFYESIHEYGVLMRK